MPIAGKAVSGGKPKRRKSKSPRRKKSKSPRRKSPSRKVGRKKGKAKRKPTAKKR